MVREVRSIDTVAREAGHDAAYLRLARPKARGKRTKQLAEVTDWLDENNVVWEKVYDFHPDHITLEGAPTCIYLSVPLGSAKLAKAIQHFCPADGSPRIAGVTFSTLSLSVAMEYSERDDPDFWDRF